MNTHRFRVLLLAIIMAGSTAAMESAALGDMTVSIDIKPGDFPNSINRRSRGKIPVAILSSPDVNAPSNVDRTSLTFGRTGDEQSLVSCDARAKDVNKDRLPDLVCTFYTQRTGFTTADTIGILKGRIKDGQPIAGQDSVRIVPPVGAGDKTPPAVIATTPVNGAIGVAITTRVTVTFSEPMNCVTLTNATFLLLDASSMAVPGTVACNSSTATFTPSAVLSYSTLYTAMITTGAKDLAGNALSSNYTWSFTTVPPPAHSISGTVSLSGGGPLPGATMTLTGAANAATTTAADGFYSFAGLLPGTYTITPSMTGYVFTSATVTITSADVTQDFTALSAVPSYSVSGTVNYTGGRSGRIYVSLRFSGGGGEPGRGTSLEVPGAFTIRGVQPGNYNIYAWMDTIGNGIQNIANPSGMSMGTFTVSGTDVTGIDVMLADPVLPAPTAPTGLYVSPLDGAAIVFWNTVEAPNGQGTGATAYRVSWSFDGGATYPASVVTHNPNDSVYFHDGLTNNQVLYYRVSSFMEGAESAPSAPVGPVVIGTPAGGVSVSGTIDFTGSAAGHGLWVALVDETNSGKVFGTRIMNPVSPQSFTISGVQPGSYSLFSLIDMDNNGELSVGDKRPNWNSLRSLPRVTVNNSDLSGLSQTLPELNATAVVATLHEIREMNEWYILVNSIGDQLKRAVKATVMSGLNVPLPIDIDRTWGGFFTDVMLGTAVPAIGDTYTFDVTYADGTSETLTASVTGVIGQDGMATPISPVGPDASTVPTLVWAAPVSPPAGVFTYIVGVSEMMGPFLWYYPNRPLTDGMPSTQTSVVYNVDGGAYQPVLTPGTNYYWWVQVTDSNANHGRRNASFTTGMGSTYTISGIVTNNSADVSHPILIGACQDAAFTICNYGTMLPPGAGGPYAIMGVTAGTYYVGAAVDSNGNGIYDPGIDPVVSFAANPVTITNASVMGIDMTIPGGMVFYSISGTVTNASADQTHDILIGACQDPAFTICNYGTMLLPGAGGPYTIMGVPAGTYYVGAIVDSNGNGLYDPGIDPVASFAANPATITNASLTGINMTIPGMPIQGEDYWVTAYNTCSYSWPAKPIDQYTEDDWALVRSSTEYILSWRGRATLGPRDANGNGLIAFTDFWEHRHKVDQSGPGQLGVTPGTGATILTTGYTLAPNNELTMTVDGNVFHLAMSRDGNFFTGVLREAGNNCQNMLMAVKAATAPVTVSGLYSLVNNNSQLLYTQQLGMPAPNPAADSVGTYGQVIWADQSATPARSGISNYLQTYPVTQADAGGHTADQMITGGGQGPQTTDPDGTITVTTGQGVWHAVSPDGQIRITAQGTNDYILSSSGSTTLYRHTLGSQLSLRQDSNITFTAADVVGTYFLSGRRDDVALAVPGTIGTTPPPSCAANAADEPGSAACGTGVHPRWKMTWGHITFDANGTASMNLTEFNDQQQETPVMYSGTLTVRKECFGNSGTSRLPWDDPVCTGGRLLDVLAINDGITDIAKFFIGSGGDVLAFYDPTGFSPAAGIAGQSRWVGSAVRLR